MDIVDAYIDSILGLDEKTFTSSLHPEIKVTLIRNREFLYDDLTLDQHVNFHKENHFNHCLAGRVISKDIKEGEEGLITCNLISIQCRDDEKSYLIEDHQVYKIKDKQIIYLIHNWTWKEL